MNNRPEWSQIVVNAIVAALKIEVLGFRLDAAARALYRRWSHAPAVADPQQRVGRASRVDRPGLRGDRRFHRGQVADVDQRRGDAEASQPLLDQTLGAPYSSRLANRKSPAAGPYFIVYRETEDTAPGVPGRQAGLSGQGSPP